MVDHYDPDWTQLWYILLSGSAQLLEDDPGEAEERRRAVRLLRQKYPQYRTMDIDDSPVIKNNSPSGHGVVIHPGAGMNQGRSFYRSVC